MTKNELMYTYALDEYKNVVKRKNEIRNRAFAFYSFNVPLITALATLIFSFSEEYSCTKIIIITLSAVLFIITLVTFLMIYMPSNQLSYKPRDIVQDLRNIETNEQFQPSDESSIQNNVKKEEAKEEFYNQSAQGFLADRYVEIIEEYEKKNLYFKKVFIFLVCSIIATIVFLLIALLF